MLRSGGESWIYRNAVVSVSGNSQLVITITGGALFPGLHFNQCIQKIVGTIVGGYVLFAVFVLCCCL